MLAGPSSSLEGSTFLQYHSWNLQGKNLDKLSLWMEDSRGEALDIVVLQEVAGMHAYKFKESSLGLTEFTADDDSELFDYHILGTYDNDSHLAQVILLDEHVVDHITSARSGGRCVEVSFRHKALGCACFVLGCHLPHKNSSEEVFQGALHELEAACGRASPCPVAVLAGDWNCQMGDERFLQVATLLAHKNFHLVYPDSDTWFRGGASRRYDFFFVKFQGDVQFLEPFDMLQVSVNVEAMKELNCDHALVSLQCLVGQRSLRSKQGVIKQRSGCRRAMVDQDALSTSLDVVLPQLSASATEQWMSIKQLSDRVCVPRRSLKFKDSDVLKAFCKMRREATSEQERIAIGRVILARRAAEKKVWWCNLERVAGKGDSEAIRYIRRRAQVRANDINLVLSHGSTLEAADAIRDHFKQVLASASQEEIHTCNELQAKLLVRAHQDVILPFSSEELQLHIAKYSHERKTSRMSGIPTELLLALARDERGVQFLCEHLCRLLQYPDDAPEDYLKAFVCLLPKKTNIQLPKDYRPISLLESSLKMCTGLIFRRWVNQCPLPKSQRGALPGCQTLSCLQAAQSFLYLEWRTGKPSLWLLLDIQQAFDSLKRSKVLEFLLKGPEGLGREAYALWKFLQVRMQFHWKSQRWEEQSNAGIQQGAPPSAGLFALILGETLDLLFHTWDSRGTVRARHVDDQGSSLHGWAFVDDCIFNFLDWRDFRVGFAGLLFALQDLGLDINLVKTVLVVHPDMWRSGVDHFQAYPDHPGFACKWATQSQYLRKPFYHFTGAFNLSDWSLRAARSLCCSAWQTLQAPLRMCSWKDADMAMTLLNRYVFAKFAWFTPLIEPLQYVKDGMGTTQISMLVLLLRLCIPQHLPQELAVCLNRQRRRAVKVLLALMPSKQWMFQVMTRKWHFLGHCLRREAGSLELAILAASDASRCTQAKPAPWHNSFSFLQTACMDMGWCAERPSLPRMQELAGDRAVWANAAYNLSMQHVVKLPYFQPLHWSHWRQPLRASEPASWYLGVYVLCSQDSLWAAWLSQEFGAMFMNIDHGFLAFLQMLQCTRPLWNVEFLVTPSWADVILPQIPQLTRDVFRSLGVVACFSVIPEGWNKRVAKFCSLIT